MNEQIKVEKELIISSNSIKDKIHILRDTQIILDRDLAEIYNIETRALKQAVNRNKKRFPEDFMFTLTEEEVDIMVSQNVIPSKKYLGGSLPYAFTEQGIANLSSILNSSKAIEVNIQIMRAFVQMRRFLSANALIFEKLDNIEKTHLLYDENFKKLFNALEVKKPKQGIFFDGQVFDAYQFVSDLIRDAQESIAVIDNYVDDSVLTLFSKRKKNVSVVIYTRVISKQLKLDAEKYNSQYPPLSIKEFNSSHDRFMIIDKKDVYHIGASLKDLGNKWFAFSRIDQYSLELLERLKHEK